MSDLQWYPFKLCLIKFKSYLNVYNFQNWLFSTVVFCKSDGMVERFHCSLKSSLYSKLAGSGWIHHLPLVLLGLRSALKYDMACSSAEAVYGSPLMLPRMFLDAPEFPLEIFHKSIQSCRVSQLLLVTMFVQQLLLSLHPWKLQPMCLPMRTRLLLLSNLCIEVHIWFF